MQRLQDTQESASKLSLLNHFGAFYEAPPSGLCDGVIGGIFSRDGVIQNNFWRDGVIGGPSVIVIRQNFGA